MSRSQLPPQLFRIIPGPVVHTTDETMDPARLCDEINYLSDYAGKMAECLDAGAFFEVGFVEDVQAQTAFYRLPVNHLGDVLVNGVTSTARKKSLSALLKELWDE
jgi:hypothetical protein